MIRNLLSLPLLFLLSSYQAATGEEESVLAVYDLRPVAPSFDDDNNWTHSLVLPPADPYDDEDYLKVRSLHDGSDSADVVVDLVTQVLGDELRFEGREISLEGRTRLLVMAPQAVQDRVAATLRSLEEAVSSSVALRLDVLTLDVPWQETESMVVSNEEAQRIVTGLVGRGASHQEFTQELFSGRTSALDLMRRTPFVYDYDLEIAQAAVIYEPIVVDALTGTRIFLRGVPMSGGLALSVVFQDADAVREVVDRPLSVRASIAREKDGVSYVEGPSTFQSIEILSRSFAFDTHLPQGQALLFASHANLGGRASHQLVVLSQVGGSLKPFHRGGVSGSKQELLVVNSELWGPPHLSFQGPERRRNNPHYPHVKAAMRAEPSLFVFDWMKYRFSIWRRLGPWAIALTDPSWDGDAAQKLGALVADWKPVTSLVDVEVALASGRDDNEAVSWRVPVRAGSRGGAMVGVSTNLLRSFSSTVANLSSAPDPELRAVFSGLSLAFEPALGHDGSVRLGLNGQASLQLGPIQSIQISGPTIGHVERVDMDVLEIDERLRFEGSDGVRRLGDAGGEGQEPSLDLSVRVRRP